MISSTFANHYTLVGTILMTEFSCPRCRGRLRRIRKPFSGSDSPERLGLFGFGLGALGGAIWAPWPYWIVGAVALPVLIVVDFLAWRLVGPFALFRCDRCGVSFPYATIVREATRAN